MSDLTRVPYRIQILFNDLCKRPELGSCKIQLANIDFEKLDDARFFPSMQHDPVRILITKGDHNVGIMGRLQQGEFHYIAAGWIGESGIDATWGMICSADIRHHLTVVEYAIGMFDQVAS